MKKLAAALTTITAVTAMALSVARAEQVGEVGVDWLGNDIIIEAVHDPQVEGVTCHVAYFERGLVDRLQKGNWFEDPSNSSIACRQTGPVVVGDIDLDEGGEDLQAAPVDHLEEAGHQAGLRQDQRYVDLSRPFEASAGWLGQDVTVDGSPVRTASYLDER